MQRQCRIEITGRLPAGLRDEMDRRFGPTDVRERNARTTLTGPPLDQAGLRALLGVLWDAGLEVTVVRTAAAARDHVDPHPATDGTD